MDSTPKIPAPPGKKPGSEDVQVAWRMAGMAWRFTTEVIAGALMGWLVGTWLGNANVGALVGTGIGLVVAMYSLMRGALKLNASLDHLAAARRAKQGGGAARPADPRSGEGGGAP